MFSSYSLQLTSIMVTYSPFSYLSLAGFMLLLDLASASPAPRDCQEDLPPVVIIDRTPIFISTLVCSDTALTFGTTRINVTSAPTLLVTSFDVVATSTSTIDR